MATLAGCLSERYSLTNGSASSTADILLGDKGYDDKKTRQLVDQYENSISGCPRVQSSFESTEPTYESDMSD